MEKERSLHELYKILYKSIKDKPYIIGLCARIKMLTIYNLITQKEEQRLYTHFIENKPNTHQHSEFLKSNTWKGGTYWWFYPEDTNPVNRKKFIRKMIRITK